MALHGFNHHRIDSKQPSEFAGQPRQVQGVKIEEGLSILRACFPGAALEVFIPPWDSFDSTTADFPSHSEMRWDLVGEIARPGAKS